MKQKKIETIADALNMSTTAIAGATDMGAAGPKYNTAEVLTTDSEALLNSRNVYDAALITLATRQRSLESVRASARLFVIKAKDLLKLRFGVRYSEAWNVAVGFVGGTRVPSSTGDLKVVLQKLASYFTTEPSAQNTEANITAAQAQIVYEDLCANENALNAQKTVVNTKLNDRNAKFNVMKRRLRGLIKELGELLDPLDARWLSFGLNKPGAQQTPDVPQNVVAVLIGTNAVAVQWEAAPRAEHYRVWIKVIGVDQEMRSVGSRADLDFTIEELPANSTIEIAVSAVNNGGESGRSTVVTVTTH